MINDPLFAYHTLIRRSLPSGMPNVQYQQPHPYDMSMQSMALQKNSSQNPEMTNSGHRRIKLFPRSPSSRGGGRIQLFGR